MRWITATAALVGLAVCAPALQPQSAGETSVRGQVAIVERPGERTEDLQNVVVYLVAAGATSRAAASRDANVPGNSVIALQSRQFSPRVRVVTEGTRIEFPNQDPFSHNVFSKTNGGFDTGAYGRGKVREQRFETAGVYPLYCNVHPRMTAFVITLATPHYAQAGADGRFTLDSVPAGRYRLHVWHDRATPLERAITVTAAGSVNVGRIELDARGYKYVQHKNKLGVQYKSATGDRY